jgi:DNA polymerase-3 subunit gamma/tau
MLNGGELAGVSESVADRMKADANPKERPFELSQLIQAWKKFAESVDAAQLRSALSVREPIFTEDYNIVYNLDNEVQRQRITLDLKPKLLAHLHTALHNDKITVEFNVTENKEDIQNKPYTNQEKFNALAAKYPLLSSMRQKFGLDFD